MSYLYRPILALSRLSIIIGQLSIIIDRVSVESADCPYQTCFTYQDRLSRPTGIGQRKSSDSHRLILLGPSGYGPLASKTLIFQESIKDS